eukprot:11197340-Lingulodinium_polyedra.AAC.1
MFVVVGVLGSRADRAEASAKHARTLMARMLQSVLGIGCIVCLIDMEISWIASELNIHQHWSLLGICSAE